MQPDTDHMSTMGLPPVPQTLLAPLLQWAGEVLHDMEVQDVPPSVRPLLGFDRRGFGSAAARAQLHKALEVEDEFRERVFEAFRERREVTALLEGWEAARAAELASDAAERDDLALLASALVAARPEGWELGLGVVTGFHHREIEAGVVDEERRAYATRVERAEETQRRAEGELEKARAEVSRLGEELKEERASRRKREEAIRSETEEAARHTEAVQRELEEAGAAIEQAEARVEAEVARVRELEAQLDEARTEAAKLRATAEQAEQLAREVEQYRVREAERLPQGLAGLSREEIEALAQLRRTGGAAPGAESTAGRGEPQVDEAAQGGGSKLSRRVTVPLPPGVVGTSVDGLQGALSGHDPAADPAVIVDGYNVSMLAWGDAEPDAQRQRLCALLERMHLRTNRSVTVVFDGADVEGVRPPRRPGVRVVFSAPGEEADAVVVREVATLPLERPAIVVSSDRWVQDEAESAGALAVPSDVFLEYLRK